jgi:hypothetical protein
MKNHIRDTCKMNMKLVPPGCYQQNVAKVAICNFKSHFPSVLAGVADDFPQNLWDRLLPQTKITLNLIRQSNTTPTVSAYTHLSGPFNYNKMLLAPMGCKAQIHEKTNKGGTWAYHSIDGWYLFISPEHCHTHMCHVKATKSKCHSDTVHFKHKNITNPTITHTDKVMQTLAECAKTITGATGGTTAQMVKDLQRIVKATQAILHKCKAPSNNSNAEKLAPRVPNIPRVHTLPRVPPATADNQQITRAMSKNINKAISALTTMPTSAPTPDTISKPTSAPTTSAKQDRLRKRRIARLHNNANTTSNSPQIRTWAQLAMVAARVAPPAMSTQAHARSSIQPPTWRPGTTQGFAAAVMRQKQHRQGMMHLTRKITQLENEVHQAMAVMDADTGKLLNYCQLMWSTKYRDAWSLSSANEFGWLANGVGGCIKNPTNIIQFINQHEVPKEQMKDVTYGQFVCTVEPKKAEPNCTRFTVGGDRINYPGEVATMTAEMLVAKMLFNSVISTRGAQFMTMDISNFYLMTPLHRPEFICMKLSNIPDEIINEYKLRNKTTPSGSIYIVANRGMYGLPQSGLIANKHLEKRLNKHGYRQSKLVPGLWGHDTRPIQFTLVVDDFGVKYVGKEHAMHLKKVLELHYKLTCNWTGTRYIRITLDWDYKKRQDHLSMPYYVKKALK